MSKEQILSSDGLPLEVSLKKAERKNKLKAVALVAPLFLFILIIYVFPIGDMLFRSVDDRMITKMLPKTFAAANVLGSILVIIRSSTLLNNMSPIGKT